MNEEQTYLCSECGAAVTEEYLHEFDERILCSSCLDNLTTICNCCSMRFFGHFILQLIVLYTVGSRPPASTPVIIIVLTISLLSPA